MFTTISLFPWSWKFHSIKKMWLLKDAEQNACDDVRDVSATRVQIPLKWGTNIFVHKFIPNPIRFIFRLFWWIFPILHAHVFLWVAVFNKPISYLGVCFYFLLMFDFSILEHCLRSSEFLQRLGTNSNFTTVLFTKHQLFVPIAKVCQ